MNATELRPGNYFIEDGNLYLVMDILLNKTAMRKMVAKVKTKNVRTGAITELSFNSGYNVEPVRLEKKKMNYLYDSGDFLVFMDNETYEQIELPRNRLEDQIQFLKENLEVDILTFEDEILGITLPAKVVLKITHCEPAVRGDTVNKAMKDATLETGATVRVPLFVNEGDEIYVRTDTGDYDGRA
jgi:elongation factor P